MDKSIRKVTDLEEQQAETYRYWASRTVAEKFAAIDEIVRQAYRFKGIRVDEMPSSRTLVRVERPDWKAL
jgi:hypothetical protein